MKYRIKSYLGEYSIQLKLEVKKCCGFWRKSTEAKWFDCNREGTPVDSRRSELVGTYKSLKEAKKRVKLLKKGVKYHKI